MNKGCISCPYGPGNFEEMAIAKQNPAAYCPDAYSEQAKQCGMYNNKEEVYAPTSMVQI